jgi:valyl-tRNA synthetase
MQLPKVYEPQAYESDIYALWEKSGAFSPSQAKDYFSLVVPPPNANANLHIGTGMTIGLEDIAARYHRMKGESVLFVPGADHAGFETQAVFEKHLAKEGKSRFDFSRDELYKRIWDFVAENRAGFEKQFRALGASVDWTRFAFTLDEKIIKTAYSTFKKMWQDGLVYRGERLVNFCTFHGTAFADVEVEYKDVKGKLWYIKYPLTDGSGNIMVATTRPETMLGDSAVAVHPEDERYQKFIGKTVRLPLTHREIPVIADDFVDKEFGTGAVKITPAHDQNDFEAGERHDLPKITVIDHEGKMTHEVPAPYRGLSVEEARALVVKDLDKQNLLVKAEDYVHGVGHCYKCGTPIQPLLKEQWFVDMKPLAAQAIKALKENQIVFYPESKKDQLIRYLEGLRDWNISRQIAWGIPIPAFQNIEDPEDWIYDEQVGKETITVGGKTYRRDSDVFDTWFSSGSWPYATLNFPDGEEFKQFYPLSLMETGGEILYPWVSRMLMMGLYTTGKIPFKNVYIHGYVLAEDGAKMSKSLGNVVDLTEVIDKYGSDALRMGLIAGRVPAVNRGYDHRKVEEARNFANKLWNIARFTEDILGDFKPVSPAPKTAADHWLLARLADGTDKITRDLEAYRFGEAYEALYHLVWDDLADWYIEASKLEPNKSVLAYALETVLKLAHPFAPFVSETIWQTLAWYKDTLLITGRWPSPVSFDKAKSAEFEEIRAIVSEIRAISNALKRRSLNLYYSDAPFIQDNAQLIKRLAGLSTVGSVKAGHGLHLTATRYNAWLDIDQQTALAYMKRLETKKAAQEKAIAQLKGRLDNKDYLKKAPAELVGQTKEQLGEATLQLDKISQELKRFEDSKF